MLAHIGITINNKEDIKKFYQELLGMERVADFSISRKISNHIGITIENRKQFVKKVKKRLPT